MVMLPETRLEVEQYSETVYIVRENSNSTQFANAGTYFHFNLPDDIDITEMWDARGTEYDLSGVYNFMGTDNKAYDETTKTVYLRAAVPGNPATLSYRCWAGCYYFKLSDGRIITVIYDSLAHSINSSYPNSISIFDYDKGDVISSDFEVSGIAAIGNKNDYSFRTIVEASLQSDSPIRLKAHVESGGDAHSAVEYMTIASNTVNTQQWAETFECFAFVNGKRLDNFNSSNDLSKAYSEVFSLTAGLNIVEVCVDISGFNTNGAKGESWFSKAESRLVSVVYLIDYEGETGELPAVSDDTGLQGGIEMAAISGLADGSRKFERKPVAYTDGVYVFSAPESYTTAPEIEADSYSKGAVISIIPNDSNATVEILETEVLAGERIGTCFGINLFKLPASNTLTVRVTSADRTKTQDYPVRVVFADSTIELSAFSVSGASLDDAFDNSIHAYYITYDNDTDNAAVEFTIPDGATATVDGVDNEGSAVFSPQKHLHTLKITASDGVTTSTYYFITKLSDGTVPYFTVTEDTKKQVTKLLGGYWNSLQEKIAFESTWDVYMAMAAGAGLDEDNNIIPVEWDGKYVFDPMLSGNVQATYPARDILQLVMLGQNPYDFNDVNFVERLQEHSGGEPWANNIWYNLAAKAAGIEPLFKDSLMTNARSDAYDLDMRAWTIASLNGCFGLTQKDMVEFVEGLHSVQATYENGLGADLYKGLFRGLAFYNNDGNAFTIGCVLSAIASVGGDPDVLFAYSHNGKTLNPLDQIEAVLWEPESGIFKDSSGGTGYVKDIIIGLGDILQGSNVWNRCALTEEKFNDLAAKASDSAKAAALSAAELTEAPDFGGADYGKYYYFLYEAVADELEESGDTSMRPKVIWDTPVGQFQKAVAALPAETEDSFVSSVADVIELYEKLYAADGDAFTDAVGTDTMTAYRDAVAAALTKQDGTGDTADFYKRVMALPDALLITEDSREEVDALRALYDGMTAEQRDLIDWAGASVLLRLQAAEAALGQGSGSTTMTIHFALLGAPDDGPNGTVNTLKDGNLDTWLEDDYTFNAETISAEQAFRVIMGDAGISWKGGSSNSYGTLYVSAVKNPATGEWMEEFTTGENSGWMYTVNGLHPNMGLSAYMLADGDSFIFHYTDDFTLETDPWDGTIINDEEKTGATTVITDAATGTFVVECDRACAVLAKTEDGSYVLLPATVTPGADGDIVSFTAGDYDEVLIRVKGDLNGDGAVDSTDTLMMKKLVAGLMEPDEITALLMDLTGDGIANSTDTLKMKRVAAGLDTLAW